MNQYFIAIIPPEDIRLEIQHLKEEIRDRFGAKHALKLPAHITLIPPFRIKEDREFQLLQALEVFATIRKPFHLSLSGFGEFAPRVLFVKVVEKEKVIDLHNDLCKNLSAIPNIPECKDLHPHLTLANRDLTETGFHAARKYLSDNDYESRFEVMGLSLLKHNGVDWDIFMDFNFKKS